MDSWDAVRRSDERAVILGCLASCLVSLFGRLQLFEFRAKESHGMESRNGLLAADLFIRLLSPARTATWRGKSPDRENLTENESARREMSWQIFNAPSQELRRAKAGVCQDMHPLLPYRERFVKS